MPYKPKTENEPIAGNQQEAWNMANEFMKLLIGIISAIVEIENEPIQNGEPQWSKLVRLQRNLYQLSSMYLDVEERAICHKDYLDYFIEYPVVDEGGITHLPSVTEDKLFEFPEYLLTTLKKKGVIVPPAFDPNMVF